MNHLICESQTIHCQTWKTMFLISTQELQNASLFLYPLKCTEDALFVKITHNGYFNYNTQS